jgi:hypothetical protein
MRTCHLGDLHVYMAEGRVELGWTLQRLLEAFCVLCLCAVVPV